MSTKGHYDFVVREELYRTYTDSQLEHAKKDAITSRENMRGYDITAENWYADDVHTILAEIIRRRTRGETNVN